MNIDFHATVQYTTKRATIYRKARFSDRPVHVQRNLCFMHAVQRAMNGEEILVEVISVDNYSQLDCDDCLAPVKSNQDE